MAELQLRVAVCPRYWGRLWRYRWIVHASNGHTSGVVAEGYAWTRNRAFQDARQATTEAYQELRR